MTNNKFKQRRMKITREQFVKEFVRAAEDAHFLAVAHALDPLVNTCEALGSQVWFAKTAN